MTFKTRFQRRALLAMALSASVLTLLGTRTTIAETYPDRPITIVVPFAAGGGTDSIAREIGAHLQKKLGKPVVIENVGGGGGAIGASRVAESDPDGYNLLFVTSTFVTHAAVDSSVPYDVNKDFTPIAQLGHGPLLVVVNKGVAPNTIQELIAAAKDAPDDYAFASAGPGSINHLSGELFNQMTGTEILHIPYKGSGPATLDLVGGSVQLFFATVPTMLGQVKAGEVKLLATTGAERSSLFPDIPTVQEAGIQNFDVETWWGIVGPAGLPEPIVEKLNAAINEVLEIETVKKRFVGEGASVTQDKPGKLGETISTELTDWKTLVGEAGIKAK